MLRVGGGFWHCLGVGGMLVGAFRGRERENQTSIITVPAICEDLQKVKVLLPIIGVGEGLDVGHF